MSLRPVSHSRRSSMRLRSSVSPHADSTPSIFNSGLDSASPTAKTSSISSPISVSMMTFCCCANAPRQTAKHAAKIFKCLLIDIFIQPLQLFTHFDVAMPRILIQPMPLTRKRKKGVRHMNLLKRPLHQHIFKKAHTYISVATHQMRRRLHLIKLKERRL